MAAYTRVHPSISWLARHHRFPAYVSSFKRPVNIHRAAYHDYVRFPTPGGSIRLPLNSPKLIGVANSRGERDYQEDYYAFASLSLDPEELRLSVKKHHGIDWNPLAVGETFAKQVVFVGIYDGHGGSAVAQYLRQELHGLFESVDKTNIPELYLWIKEVGGYFKRYRGGVLEPWVDGPTHDQKFDLEARATQAFFEVDRTLAEDRDASRSGATASVALLHSLDIPATPFFSAQKLALTIAHCGDTRILLCATEGGAVLPMTEKHHADSVTESERLRRIKGSALVTDSFGESRWMGALENTRSLGDLQYKRFGVTAEPEVRSKLLNGPEWAYMVLISDGVAHLVSDEEVVALAREAHDPKTAAQNILSYTEDLGGVDNMTAIVVPLAGWGKITGPNPTKELIEYRRRNAAGTERQRRM